MFKKIDNQLLQFAEGLVYLALIALVFVSGVCVLFAIPVLIGAELLRMDFIEALKFAGAEVVAIYVARGSMRVLKQVKISGTAE